ncbi:DUF998 domain-containing protein [Nocardia sp. NPDC005366]|uniref:DUF998 domain-containing protein n=1 Tax=Nocardia sp. NPDC005366 TaxID=3156878 RepID=UPI0033AD2D36
MTDSPRITERRARVGSWLIAVAIAVAGLCYSSWVLEFALPIHVDYVNSFLSELDAEGKPYREVFSTGDKIAATLMIPASIGGLLLFPRRALTTVGWIALLCFGTSTIADVLMPLHDCTPGDGSDCGAGGLFPQLHQPHALTSTLAVTSIAVAVFAFSLAAYRYHRWRILREAGVVILVLGASATVWMLVADNLTGNYALGIAQRIQVGSMSLWLITLAAAVVLEAREWIEPVSRR